MASVSPRTLASGEVRWRVQVRVKGQMKQTTFLEKKGADQFAAMIDKHGWEAAEQVRIERGKRTDVVPTLSEYTARYLSPESGLLTGVEKGTREGYESEAERSFLQRLGDYPVDLISKQDVGSWLAWQERQPVWRDRNKPPELQHTVSSKTVRNYHALLSAIFKAAVAEGLRPDNPAFKIRITRGVKKETIFLSLSEFDTLHHFIPEHYKDFTYFLAGTGLRWGEATALRWSDVNLFGDPPTVRVTRAWKKAKGAPILSYPKTSKSRRSVALSDELVEALGEPGASDEFVFKAPNGGHMWHGAFHSRAWLPAVRKAMDEDECRKVGLVPLRRAPTIHGLRHAHASWLVAQGVPLPYVQVRLGHESITTTVNTYTHLVPDAHASMANVMAEAMRGMRVPVALRPLRMPLAISQHAES